MCDMTCVWCDSAIVSGAEFIGGQPIHPCCADEYFADERDAGVIADWDGREDEEAFAEMARREHEGEHQYIPELDDEFAPDEYVWDRDFGIDG